MEGAINMKNNLIQNFYIIGVPYQDIISSIDSNEALDLSKSFNPKMLSKFTKDINNINTVSDNLIIEHCFPNNINIKKGKMKYNKNLYHFEFSFDNKLYQYIEKNRCLYSKIHLTCVEFYESINDYLELDNLIKNNNIDKNDINNEEILKKYEEYYVPKVICFASLMSFSKELYKILKNIYDFYKKKKKNK